MAQELNVRKDFLDDFTKRIINSITNRKSISISLAPREIRKQTIDNLTSDFDKESILSKKAIQVIQYPQKQKFIPPRPMGAMSIVPNPIVRKPINPIIAQIPIQNQQAKYEIMDSMKKLSPFILDQFVQSIECKGPGKPLLVLKGTSLQVTNIILTKEEIDVIMQDISKQTRIPLMQGLFRALFGNLIITAVISEFVGTRFVIEKRRNI